MPTKEGRPIYGPSCMGKISYERKDDAKGDLAKLKQLKREPGWVLKIFRCSICGYHHIGNKPKGGVSNAYLRQLRRMKAEDFEDPGLN